MAEVTFGYLGWSGRGNLGDDAIHEAIEQAFPQARFEEVSMYPKRLARAVKEGRISHLRNAAPFITGGTSIGRMNWRLELNLAMLLTRRRPAVMLGAGVEDPSFQGDHSFSSSFKSELVGTLGRRLPDPVGSPLRDKYASMRSETAGVELRQWRPLLEKFATVAVRGPRSAELLADAGIEAKVVGDPALLLRPQEGLPQYEDKTIGITLGYGDDLWGHSQDNVATEIGKSLKGMMSDGWHVRFIVVNESDRKFIAPCAAAAGIEDADLDVVNGIVTADFFHEVAKCDVFAGERLHSTILAMAVGIPSIMIEYQPKCLDFMRSVNREAWNLRTDRLDSKNFREMVDGLHSERQKHFDETLAAVDELRGRLQAEVDHINKIFWK